jgi:quercetin dioxygenase-like cupin family protein
MANPFIREMAIADNVLVYMNYLIEKGDEIQDHAHVFDHITLLARGSVKMEHDGGSKEYTAPYLIITPKNIQHKFTALEDKCLLCCIHAIRDGDEIEDIAPQDISLEKALELFTKHPIIQVENSEV